MLDSMFMSSFFPEIFKITENHLIDTLFKFTFKYRCFTRHKMKFRLLENFKCQFNHASLNFASLNVEET